MPGIKISSNGSQLDALRATFRTYAAWNGRDSADLFLDQSRKLATELYQQTAAIAPTKAEIAADVKALGWKIPTKFKDGRLARGYPAQWLGWAWEGMQRKIRRKGRKSKKDHQSESTFMARKPTLAQMQKFVIDIRSNARLFLASGWLGAIVDLGGTVKSSSGAVDRARGGATVRRRPGSIEVEFWNRTPGIETMNAQKHFVEKAIAVRTVDMMAYIRRKQAEALQKMKAA